MKRLSILILIGVLGLVGCRSSDFNARVFHTWGWENAKEAKAYLDQFQHVLVADVYEYHWEDLGPNRLTPYHFKGTVVRSYKGDWKVGETVAFIHRVDAPAPTNAPPAHGRGEQMFIFTNEHTDAEIGVDTGDFGTYNAEYAPALEFAFSRSNGR